MALQQMRPNVPVAAGAMLIGGTWQWLIDGQIFALEALDQLGIPASLR